MNTQTIITIEQARQSQSGKSLGVQDRATGTWYITKCWDLQNMVGQTITAQTSESDWQGKPQYWINDFYLPDGQPGGQGPSGPPAVNVPAPQPTAPRPPAQPPRVDTGPAAHTPVPPAVDRDASIVAQTLCKTVSFSSIDQAWMAYTTLYDFYIQWRDKGGIDLRAAEANEQLNQQQAHAAATEREFDDNIPF